MEPEQQAAEAVIDETQAADFARLSGMAQENEAAPADTVAPSMADELTALVTAFVAIAAPILPSVGRIYTAETTGAACAAVAAVCEKHGWAQGGFMSEWGVEIGAAVVLVPLAIATVQGVKSDLAENDRRTKYIELKKQADLVQHMNIAHNLDGKTEKPSPFGAFGNVEPAPTAEGGAVENG